MALELDKFCYMFQEQEEEENWYKSLDSISRVWKTLGTCSLSTRLINSGNQDLLLWPEWISLVVYIDQIDRKLLNPYFSLFCIKMAIESTLKSIQFFPGGSVVKNLSANSGDTYLILDLGRSHVWQSHQGQTPQPLSLCSRAWEQQIPSPHAANTEACLPSSSCVFHKRKSVSCSVVPDSLWSQGL